MATKSTSKLRKMIPPAIRAIIMERPLLASENPDEYDDFLLFLAETYEPDKLDWFDVKKLCIAMWEERRMNRVKPAILETAPVAEQARSKEAMLTKQYKVLAAEHPDKYNKKMVQQAIKDIKLPPLIINAKAFVERLPELETMEQLQLSYEARQRVARQQLDNRNTIELSREKANDNEDVPPNFIHRQDGDEGSSTGSHKKGLSGDLVSDQEAASVDGAAANNKKGSSNQEESMEQDAGSDEEAA